MRCRAAETFPRCKRGGVQHAAAVAAAAAAGTRAGAGGRTSAVFCLRILGTLVSKVSSPSSSLLIPAGRSHTLNWKIRFNLTMAATPKEKQALAGAVACVVALGGPSRPSAGDAAPPKN